MTKAWVLRLYLFSWSALALLSLLDYRRAEQKQCFFNTSWLLCDGTLSLGLKIAVFLLITVMSFSFVAFGWEQWKIWENRTAIKYLPGVLILLAFLTVPFGSSDTNYYFYAGKASAEGLNPYIQNWDMEKPFVYPVPHDTITSFSYGPLMLRSFELLYKVSRGDIAVFIVLWKLLMTAAFIGAGALTFRLIREFKPDETKTSFRFFWALQPLFLFEVLVNGHFDIVWVVTILASILFAMKNKWHFVIPLLVFGIWIKYIPLLFSPFFALWWWQETRKDNWKKSVSSALMGVALAGFVTLLSWGSLWQGPQVFASVVMQSKWAVISWFAIVYYSLKPLFVGLFGSNSHFYTTRLAHAVILMVFLYFLWPYLKKIFRVILKKDVWKPLEFIQAMFVCMMLYLFIWQKSMWPWYTVWLIPLGLVLYGGTKSETTKKIVRWLGSIPFVFYSIWLANWWLRGADGGSELWFYYVMVLSTTLYPLYLAYQWRHHDYEYAKH